MFGFQVLIEIEYHIGITLMRLGWRPWDNLFAFYGFNSFVKLEEGRLRADRLYIKTQ
jgi:hypothetical protein